MIFYDSQAGGVYANISRETGTKYKTENLNRIKMNGVKNETKIKKK